MIINWINGGVTINREEYLSTELARRKFSDTFVVSSEKAKDRKWKTRQFSSSCV